MKLIKLNPEHFIVVNDFYESKNDIKQEDVNSFFYHKEEGVVFVDRIVDVSLFCDNIKTEFFYGSLRKITHSTQPLDGVELISLSDVKELIDNVDVESMSILYARTIPAAMDDDELDYAANGFYNGYKKALENEYEKIYKILDIIIEKMDRIPQEGIDKDPFLLGRYRAYSEILNLLKPKTEWNVEFVDGKIKLL